MQFPVTLKINRHSWLFGFQIWYTCSICNRLLLSRVFFKSPIRPILNSIFAGELNQIVFESIKESVLTGLNKNKAQIENALDEYFKKEVLPFAPDAWYDKTKIKVGYEIPFNRYFYQYEGSKRSRSTHWQPTVGLEAF